VAISQGTLRYGSEIDGLPLLQALAKQFPARIERGHELHELLVRERLRHRGLVPFQLAIGRGGEEPLPVRVSHLLVASTLVEDGENGFGL
jgi:hypothetical protein